MIATVAEHVLSLPAWVALLVVFALPALESSAFVGFIFPGEIALILGGVMAYEGRVSVVAVLVAGIAGAAVGDSVGYAVGKRFGRRLLDGTVGRFVKSSHLDRAEEYLAERGGKAVFFGRFTAALRVLIPGLAGMSGLRYRTFLIFNLASAVGWGTMSVMLGYLGGSSWHRVEHLASRIGLGALVVVVLFVLGGVLVRRCGSDKVGRVAGAITASSPVRRIRERFPRSSGWVLGRLDPTRTAGLALTTAVAAAVAAAWTFAGITQDVVGREELALLDPRIHAWVLAHRSGSLTAFFRIVTWLGATTVTVPALAVVGGTLARRRRSWVPVLDIVAVYGTALVAHAVVSQIVHRSRPPAADWVAPAGGWAYPSGHTTQAVAAWGILALLLAAHADFRRRVLLAVAAITVGLLVGASRIYLGVHWPTDVLGGASMSGVALAVWAIVRRAVPTSSTLSSASATDPSAVQPPTDADPGSERAGRHIGSLHPPGQSCVAGIDPAARSALISRARLTDLRLSASHRRGSGR